MTLMNGKIKRLAALLKELESVVIAFSGGVDSTFLAAAAKRTLGNKAIAVTACSSSLTTCEQKEAESLAKTLQIPHLFLPSNEFNNPKFVANTPERCYFCKQDRFLSLVAWAGNNGYHWVVEGSNTDDLLDYRPGMRAIKEIDKVKSPLLDAGFSKADIRAVSKEWHLPTWNRPSAACLVSRLSYGMPIKVESLTQIEQAEDLLRQFCTDQIRVRHHGTLARIEVSSKDIPVISSPINAKKIVDGLKQLGFTYVTLDLIGYRSGSMNENLEE